MREAPKVRRIASDRFARRHRKGGKAAFIAEAEGLGSPAVDEIEVAKGPASEDISRLASDSRRVPKLWARERRYLMDGHPVELASSYVPLDLAEGTPIEATDTGPGGIYARIEEQGHTLAEFTEEVAARMPTPEERRRLRLPAGTPVLTVRRVAYDTDGRPVEMTDTVKAAPSYVLEYRFPAD